MDIDAAGGVATAGLVGGAIEKPTGEAGEHHRVCTDCGQPTTGKFCANCGQPTHVHRSLLHLAEEMLHGVLHFDARIWRTLPLLAFNPGRLTREWVQGRRARYVSPLAMFLFTLFLLFFGFSFFGGDVVQQTPMADRVASARAGLDEARVESDGALTALYAAQRPAGAPVSASGSDLEDAVDRFDSAANDLAEASDDLERMLALQAAGPRADGFQPGSWQAELKDATPLSGGKADGYTGWKGKVFKKLQNPDLVVYKLQQTLYKFAFLLVPLSIPFVALLFLWKRGFTLYDHGVFVLYSLTAMAVLFTAAALVGRAPGAWGGLLVSAALLAAPVHMFAQLKGAYGLSWFSATWRTIMLLFFCNIVVSLFLIAIILLGMGV